MAILLLVGSGCGTSKRERAEAARLASRGDLVWADEFRGHAGARPDPARWRLVSGGKGWGNTEQQCHTAAPDNVSLDGRGNLRIVARRERITCADGAVNQYTSGRLDTAGRFQFEDGRVEARIKAPSGHGLIAAFWALGRDYGSVGWPRSGEIDIAEVKGSQPDNAYGTLHGATAQASPWQLQQRFSASAPLSDGFHVYAATWARDAVQFYVDGRPYGPIRRPTDASLPEGAAWPFSQPFYLLLSLSVGNVWEGPPDRATAFPAEMRVDWVRVYRLPRERPTRHARSVSAESRART
jgi:beta-glucanase (GH16 family)